MERRSAGAHAARLWLVALWLALAPSVARAQFLPKPLAAAAPATAAPAAAPGAAAKPAAPPAAPEIVPIAVPEIARSAEAISVRLRELDGMLAPLARIEALEAEAADLVSQVTDAREEADRLLESGPRMQIVQRLGRLGTLLRERVSKSTDEVTALASKLEAALDELKQERAVWLATQQGARSSMAPEATLQRVEDVLQSIRSTRDGLQERRSRVLVLADSLSKQLSSVDAGLAAVEAFRTQVAGQPLRRDARVIWHLDFGGGARGKMIRDFWNDVTDDASELATEGPVLAPRLFLSALLFLALVVFFRRARADARRRESEDPSLARAGQVYHEPVSAALLLSLIFAAFAVLPETSLLRVALALVGVIPAIRILRRLIHVDYHGAIHRLAGFFALDALREALVTVPEVEQVVLCVETALALAILVRLMRPSRLEGVEIAEEDRRRLATLGWLLRGLCALFAISLAGTIFGFMQLARQLAGGALSTLYAAALLYAAAHALDGLVIHALRVPPLSLLRAVEKHAETIERATGRWTGRAAFVLLIAVALTRFGLEQVASEALRRALAFEIVPGDIELTIGDIALFALAVVVSVAVARFTRVVLEDEIYPRVSLGRGVPYSISRLLHYAVVLAGCFFGVSVIGLDLTKFTLLAGALGVGIGFGLQNVVNNFVSGLILLLERPIQVGDTVQIAELQGEVTRIGTRSSTIRTFEGAEVIVPNASLIQDRVTNWTFSDRERRIEIPVGVEYGSDPQAVIALLADVARRQPRVLVDPAPVALFTGFGDSQLNFVLRCWVMFDPEWAAVRSRLLVEIHQALQEAKIGIPYPQRDVHVSGLEPLARALAERSGS